ncbi:MAG TPA: Na/Pi cotransporter family protein [Anaerolineae bacterium]|nr:Na/Pi cotransporter family protein [Anaerolineae bacterium]HPL29418.1 Na/Pi cotransporter family protein [Anaerolineae bacterium]
MFELLTVIGGLALFLFGVRMLSQGMEQLAGGKIQQWLDRATSHPIKGAAFGATATAIVQSSGLLMVTMMGLINANLLTLEQAIGVMLGQEIGTTITGQLVAFNIGNIRFVAVALGFLMLEFGQERRLQRYGQILMGFGLMFMGRELMADTVRPLATHPLVAQWLAQMGTSPLLGVAAGTILTGIIQSSTATTGLVIAMGASGVISLPAAIGFIYGANIGSCITGLMAALRSSPAGRRASFAQITINVVGVLLFLPFIHPYADLLQRLSPDLARQIAHAHTIFNVGVSIILFPFVRPLAAFVTRLAPEKPEQEAPRVAQFIDERLRSVPSIAIAGAAKEVERMGQTILQMLALSERAFVGQDDEAAREVLRQESELCDPLCDAIERFVDGVIAEGGLDNWERRRCFQLKNINVDLERVADHAENLAEAAQDRIRHQVPFSDEAMQDLEHAFQHAQLALKTALLAFNNGDQSLARRACALEDEMDHIALTVRQRHLDRTKLGICHPEADVLFVETLRNLERISDHADNIAISVLRKS